VITHGFPRATFDIDLIVPRGGREKWLRVAKDLGYQLHHEGGSFLQFNAPQADRFPLDLMLVSEATFSQLQAESVRSPSGIREIQVVSLMHLLALKCHAVKHSHARRVVKDAEDMIQLIQINRLDPERAKPYSDCLKSMEHGNFTKRSSAPVGAVDGSELEFPDWSGMDDSPARITVEAAFRLCETYSALAAKAGTKPRFERPDDIAEFVL